MAMFAIELAIEYDRFSSILRCLSKIGLMNCRNNCIYQTVDGKNSDKLFVYSGPDNAEVYQ